MSPASRYKSETVSQREKKQIQSAEQVQAEGWRPAVSWAEGRGVARGGAPRLSLAAALGRRVPPQRHNRAV